MARMTGRVPKGDLVVGKANPVLAVGYRQTYGTSSKMKQHIGRVQ